MKDGQRIDLSSACFQAGFEQGFLKEIHPGASIRGARDSAYIRKGCALGGVTMTLKCAGRVQAHRLLPEDATGSWRTEAFSATHLVCRAEDETLPLQLVQEWHMKGEVLRMTLRLTNPGSTAVSVEDLALRFAEDSDFSWGCNAASRVIGHFGLSGHNSHLMLERCDGVGPILMILPDERTHLEYFDQPENHRGSLAVYIHSAMARQAAEQAGASIHLPATCVQLAPGETREYGFRLLWAEDRAQAREKLVRCGLMDVQVLPGMTVPEGTDVLVALRGSWPDMSLSLPEGCELADIRERGEYRVYRLRFARLGENTLWLRSGERYANLEFFVTEKLQTLLEKRGAFIAGHQVKDESLWYDGLLAEWNNETAVQLGPDNYDRIGGWRIYEVTCDDPGLSKPAFLSSKLVELPDAEQAAALDRYVERFVWGGLQCTEEEPYPYGIYEIGRASCRERV